MYIEKLILNNFRNYKNLDISFNKNLNIFVGNNAQGKTNILEAIYLCATGRTHKTSKDGELKNFFSDSYYVNLDFIRQESNQSITISYSNQKGKLLKINSIKIDKLRKLIGNLVVIIFSPEDLNIVKGAPSDRRRFLDMILSQIKPNYFTNLQDYQRVIKNRNALLKSINKSPYLKDTIDVWDEKLVNIGAKIVKERLNFIEKLNIESNILHKKISGEKEIINLNYKSDLIFSVDDNIKSIEKKIYDKLIENQDYEIQRRSSLYGPHRDDLIIEINKINLKIFGSQGQQRTAILSIILSKLEIIKDEIGEYPILLLDDVSSELDRERLEKLLDLVKRSQTFITTTGYDNLIFEKEKSKIFNVENGKIIGG
ncbi:MAG: DNA replication/repair protein RecF [Clostridiales bacterium]